MTLSSKQIDDIGNLYENIIASGQEEQLNEISVNFGGQAAVNKARAEQQQKVASDSRLANLRQQRFGSGGAPSSSSSSSTGLKGPTAADLQKQRQATLQRTGGVLGAGGGQAAIRNLQSKGVDARSAYARVYAQGEKNLANKPTTSITKPSAPPSRDGSKPSDKPPAPPSRDGSKPSAPPQRPPAGPAITKSKPEAPKPLGFTPRTLTSAELAAATAARAAARSAGKSAADVEKDAIAAVSKLQKSSFDIFDVIKGHLLDEGYADTEEAALAIMANMSEEWRQDIVEAFGFRDFRQSSQPKKATEPKPAPPTVKSDGGAGGKVTVDKGYPATLGGKKGVKSTDETGTEYFMPNVSGTNVPDYNKAQYKNKWKGSYENIPPSQSTANRESHISRTGVPRVYPRTANYGIPD